MDYSWINHNLAIGSAPSEARDFAHLARRGIRAVVDLREEAGDDPALIGQYGMDFLRMLIADGTAPDVQDMRQIVEWVANRIAEGKKVYIHCQAGVGRSPTVAAAYLIYRSASPTASPGAGPDAGQPGVLTVPQALHEVSDQRPDAQPNDAQIQALRRFYDSLLPRLL